jgi:ABC-type transport system involved in multi-copper enzyme maturation permease subunit
MMIPAIKSEFQKMFSVRSTYVILLIVLLLVALFAFYVNGWKATPGNLQDPTTIAKIAAGAVNTIADFAGLVAVLLMTQEYRYNLIAYTLTASNNRNKVLGAKIVVASCFGIGLTLLIGWLAPLAAVYGAHLHSLHFVPQTIHYGNLVWRGLYFGWGYTMAALLIATIIRNQIGSIVVLLIAPATIEGVLSLLLKHNSVYLPFTALTVVLGQTANPLYANIISPAKAAVVFAGYLIVGWLVAWILFLRRDATS